jgi:eukaryotic-like serine/threonine-protein kinase
MGADLAEEEQFGPYLVYERLGIGGMATVHRALERGIEGFERVVALKRLLPHLAEDASFIKAFVREAKLASLLSHHNIVQIYELGRVGTEYFISMEHIDGRDVRRILRHARRVTGPPPIHVTVGLLLQLCDALDYAHTRVDDEGNPLGLVHRDVSPSNLLVTSAGHLKVIDFGIAKAQSAQLRTQTGRVKGKLAYMAPEAITGKELDARSDLFAAGVIAHELLTARPLFASKNEYQTLLKVQRGDILPPSTYNPAVPPELDALVLDTLAREPEHRVRDAATLRDRLLELRMHHGLQTGHREIAQWLGWAFALEAPPGPAEVSGSVSIDPGISPARQPTPRPASAAERHDEDEAVDVAWGGGEAEASARPVVLDDIPDVSQKHLAPVMEAADDADDIPAHQPSHGLAVPVRDTAPQAVVGGSDDAGPRTSVPDAPAPRPTRARHASWVPPPATPDPDAPPRTARSLSELAVTEAPVVPAPLAEVRRRRPSNITIGAAIVERQSVRSRAGIAVVAAIGLGAAATTTALLLAGGRDDRAGATSDPVERAPRVEQTGTVRFEIEPSDVEITIVPSDAKDTAGTTHAGSPWQTQLPAGLHSIQIRREGYKARLASIELSANETLTMMITLEKLGAQTVEEAKLIVDSTPRGLEVVLDGRVQPQRTPMRMPIAAGPHTITLRQNGVEVWRHQFVAQANVDHDFNPSMTEAKLRERRQRAAAETRIEPPPPPPPPPPPIPRPDAAPPPVDAAPPAIVTPPAPSPPPPPPPRRQEPTITQPARPPAEVPRSTGPITVAPNAVTRIAGDLPALSKSRRGEVPPVVAAKLCIDAAGTVTQVNILTKLERVAILDLTAVLRGWRYAPYKHRGAPTPVCFAVSFRVK